MTFLLLSGLLGLIIGSFLNVVIVRLPQGLSVAAPRSFCPQCKATVAWYDNIPLLSYAFLLGKCRQCHDKISFRYPVVELLTAVLSMATYRHFGETIPYLLYFLFLVAPLVAVVFIDLDHQIIPDVISLPGIVLGVVIRWMTALPWEKNEVLINSLWGILVGGGFLFSVAFLYEKIKEGEGLGGGDVKLAAMFGAFFGWQGILFILLTSSILGSLFGVLLIVSRKGDLQVALPFGPFLALAALVYLYFGPPIIGWYLGLF